MTSPRPVRVMHVTYSLDLGGAEKVILDLLKSIDRARFEVSVCSFRSQGDLARQFRAEGITVVQLGKREGRDWRMLFRLWASIRRARVDVVHCHNSPMWLTTVLPARLAGARAVMLTEHASHPHLRRPWRIAARGLQHCTALITVNSEQVRTALTNELRLSAEKIRLLPNGIPLDRYRLTIDVADKRRQLGLPETARVVTNVARLVPIKDHATLLAAFAIIHGEDPGIHLVIVGPGPLEKDLKRKAADLGCAGAVHFLGRRQDVPEILAASDLFVLSSRKEGQSLAVLEAMAAGIPVVATATGGTPELIEHGKSGLLVPSGNPAALAQAIRSVMTDQALVDRIVLAATDKVERLHDLSCVVRQYEEAYDTIAAL